jgi:hypothetical protein
MDNENFPGSIEISLQTAEKWTKRFKTILIEDSKKESKCF